MEFTKKPLYWTTWWPRLIVAPWGLVSPWLGTGWSWTMDVSMDGTRVSLGFTYPPGVNGTKDSMPRLAVSNLRCGAPMNWGKLRVLASSEIIVPNPNEMRSLKNEIGYFRPQHHHLVTFNNSSIALTSSELWPLKDRPQNALREPWGLLGTGGRGRWMVSVA